MTQRMKGFALGTVLVLLAAGTAGCFNRGASGEWLNPDLPKAPPGWNVGAWWRYAGSNGITYTYTYEGTETKEGQASYRFQIALSEADEHGTSRYTLWRSSENMGAVAADQSPIYARYDCPAGRWFPLDQRVEDDCDSTTYRNGEFLAHYEESTVKIPIGWENVSLPAGDFAAYKFELMDRKSNRTFGTFWYGPDVDFTVQIIQDSGVVTRLEAWGNSPTGSATV